MWVKLKRQIKFFYLGKTYDALLIIMVIEIRLIIHNYKRIIKE